MTHPVAHLLSGSSPAADRQLPAGYRSRRTCLLHSERCASVRSSAWLGRGRGRGPWRQLCTWQCRAAAEPRAGTVDRTMMVKLSLAQSSNRLDLSECQLEAVPPEVLDLVNLEELSLAGNFLRELPEGLGGLGNLRKLQLSGNRLEELPGSLCELSRLEGLWVHGNLLKALPVDFGSLAALQTLQAMGNLLETLPDSLGDLQELRELEVAGNRLHSLPDSIGNLGSLHKLTLNGNALARLPDSIGGLASLRTLALQANALTALPVSIGSLQALEELNLSDNELVAVPEGVLAGLPKLRAVWLYGNRLTSLARSLLGAPALKELWLEGNPLETGSVLPLVERVAQLPAERKLALGLDERQLGALGEERRAAAGKRLRTGTVMGEGRGYWKLSRGPSGAAEDADGTTGERALVVSFGSAPGVPNWGGLLPRIRAASAHPAHQAWDILYVVDPERSWYNAGDEEGFRFWWERLEAVTRGYARVLMLGDSMGATAALLFSPLATAVHAFTPQVDLQTASLRPGRDSGWLGRLTERLMAQVAASGADITVHCSTWQHDLDQARLLPEEHVRLKVYGVSTHRLAAYLDAQGQLLPLIQGCLLQQMGFPSGHIRLVNLL